MADLLSIGEFSQRSGLSPKRLRSYAAAGLLVPVSVDASSGYRYYAPDQLRAAQVIDALREAGMPLADVAALLRDPSDARLDAWVMRVEAEAAERRKAVATARALLLTEPGGCPVHPMPSGKVSMTQLKTACRTETGRVRQNNEDAVLAGDRLAVVADGMGGHPGGEVASAVAVSLVAAAYTGRSLDELEAAVRAANRAIWDRGNADAELEGMGTTICAAGLTDEGRLAVVSVGDTRAYLWREGDMRRLTQDHSVTAELVSRGELSEQDAPGHPLHGYLTRALGVGPDVDLDSFTHPAVPGERLLICSDGLVNELADDEIASVLASTDDAREAADALVGLADSRGGRDNVSVVVADICAP